MALKKSTIQSVAPEQQAIASAPATAAAPESGATAAIARLKTTKPKEETKAYKPRDFDAEARGKTRCVQWEAAVTSPAIAGMRWDSIDEYLALVRKTADAGVAYTFGE